MSQDSRSTLGGRRNRRSLESLESSDGPLAIGYSGSHSSASGPHANSSLGSSPRARGSLEYTGGRGSPSGLVTANLDDPNFFSGGGDAAPAGNNRPGDNPSDSGGQHGDAVGAFLLSGRRTQDSWFGQVTRWLFGGGGSRRMNLHTAHVTSDSSPSGGTAAGHGAMVRCEDVSMASSI